MNYGQFGKSYNNSSKKEGKNYITRLLRQLTGVLIIILVLMLFRYTNTSVGENVNKFVRENFYMDYTNKATEVFERYSPEVKDAVETFVRSVEKQ